MQAFALLRSRVLPALITALGVMLVSAGLLTYVDPTTAGGLPPASPVIETLAPTETPAPSPTPGPSASGAPSPTPADPLGSLAPAEPVVATRLVIPALDVDLPVIRGPAGYPPCGVAMYLKELGQPGGERAIYLYAHARRGMMLSLLEASKVNNGRSMLGAVVQVYTNHNEVHLYEIFEVRRHQRTLDRALAATGEELWMQTSEGPDASYPKLQVVARRIAPPAPADPAEANPKAKPVACG